METPRLDPADDASVRLWRAGPLTFGTVLAVAFMLRVGWALVVPVVPVSDSHAYDVFARNLALYNVYGWEPSSPSAYWPVGTSFVYSLLYRTFGVHYSSIVVLNVLLGIVIVGLTMVLARRWHGQVVSVVAGMVVACWPSLVEMTTVLASELPFMALLLGAMVLWQPESRSVAKAATAGVVLGAACYVRPTAILIPAVLAALSFAGDATRPARVTSRLVVLLAFMVLAIAPWSFRNTRLFHQFVLISTNGGVNAWMGNNPLSDGQYMDLPPLVGLNEAERDAYLGREARRNIVGQPFQFVRRTIMKLLRLHERESIGVAWNLEGLRKRTTDSGILGLKIAGNVFWWAALALAMGGAVVLARRMGLRAALDPTMAMWGYFAAVHAITVVQDRYHFPSIPFIAILASITLISVSTRQPAIKATLGNAAGGS